MTCECGGNVEFTLVQDLNSKVYLLTAQCADCEKSSFGWGIDPEQALKRVKRAWNNEKRSIKRRKHA